MSIEPNDQRARSDLATALRVLRKAAGLSGERLAARCAMSQSKISRIESGRTLPSVVDVERILHALDVSAEAADELLALTRRTNVQYTSWRSAAEIGLWRKQIDLKALAESTAVQRHFLSAIPSGFLQLPEYARQLLAPTLASDPAYDVEKIVQARIERQATLEDTSRRFVFVLTEQAVRWRSASRAVMAQQCSHMAELAERPNIDLGIIPQSADMTASSPLNTFVVYDDRLVIAELFSGEVVMRDHKDVLHHSDLSEFFYSRALSGDRARALLLAVRDEFM